MSARRALSFVPLAVATALAACGDGDDDPTRPDEPGPSAGVVFVDDDAPPGGDGGLDSPVDSLAAAFAILEASSLSTARVVVLDGVYPLADAVIPVADVSIEGAGPDVTRFESTDVAWTASQRLAVSGVTVAGHVEVRADTIDATSVDLDAGGRLALVAAGDVDVTGGAFAGDLRVTAGARAQVVDSAFEGGTLTVDGADIADLTGVTVRDSVGTGVHVRDVTGRATLIRVQVFDVARRPDGDVTEPDAPVDGVGILLERSVTAVEDVLVARTGYRGIDVREGEATLVRTTIAGGGAAGLSVQGGARVEADELVASDAGTLVFSSGATTVLRGATIRDGGGSCLLASNGGAFTVVGSTLLDCPMGHVSVLGDVETTIRDTVVQNAELSACVSVAANAAPVTIEGNSIRGCAGSGVGLLEVTAVTLVDNEIRDIAPDPAFVDVADGVTAVDATFVAQGNVVQYADGTGLSLLRSTGVIAENQLRDLGDAGVRVVDPRTGGEPVRVVDNRIERATIAGIVAFSVAAVIEGNTVDDTVYSDDDGLGDAVLVGLGADVQIIDNTLRRSGSNGLFAVDGVTGRVAGNRFIDNAAYGVAEICTDPSTPVELEYAGNVFEGNRAGDTLPCD